MNSATKCPSKSIAWGGECCEEPRSVWKLLGVCHHRDGRVICCDCYRFSTGAFHTASYLVLAEPAQLWWCWWLQGLDRPAWLWISSVVRSHDGGELALHLWFNHRDWGLYFRHGGNCPSCNSCRI